MKRVLHTLYFADEVRDFSEIETGKGTIRREEMQLALRLVETLRRPAFHPEDFEDTYRARVEAAARQKARGKAVPAERPAEPECRVVDLMEALQRSLRRKPTKTARPKTSTRGGREPARDRLRAS